MNRLTIHFYSYFKDLVGCAQTTEGIPIGATVDDLLKKLFVRFPQLAPMEKSMLIAVGVEYQPRNFVLHDGEEISLFPPVQGG